MAAPTASSNVKWWELAGGANATVQALIALLVVFAGVCLWFARIEVHDQATTDHFAAIEARHAENAQARAVFHDDVEGLHKDFIDLRIMVTRLTAKIEDMKGR